MASSYNLLVVMSTICLIGTAQAITLGDKCPPTKEYLKVTMPHMSACLKEILGKDFHQKAENLTEIEHDKVCMCVAIKRGLISADMKTFNLTRSTMELDGFVIDNETRYLLEEGFEECSESSNDGQSFFECIKEVKHEYCEE